VKVVLLIPLGIGLFILGIAWLESGLLDVQAAGLEIILQKTTRTPAQGLVCGALATALVQSSSAVTAVTIALADTGRLKVINAFAVILGANIGTTVTGQFLALRPSYLILPLSLLGAGFFFKKRPGKAIGLVLLGLALIFAALELMVIGSSEAVSHWPVQAGFKYLDSPLSALLFGGLITALMQSSSLVVALAMVFTQRGLLSLLPAIAVVLGSNVGTCATALLAGLPSGAIGKKVALFQVVLNLAGAAVFYLLLEPFALFVALTASNPARQVANAHTLFNILSSLAVLPLLYLRQACSKKT